MSALLRDTSKKTRTVPMAYPGRIPSNRSILGRGEAHDLLVSELLGPLCDQLHYGPDIVWICLILMLRVTSCRHEIG